MPSDEDAAMMQSHRKQLKLSLRLRPASTNQFARLAPKIAKELLQAAAALSEEAASTVSGWRARDALWNGKADSHSSGVEFLALEIVFDDGKKVYASYNGGSVENDGCIELPTEAIVLSSNSAVGTYVTVKALPFIADAAAITADPVSTRDWELLELYAGALESGSLLNQVSVVYPGQVLTLSVGGGTASDIARVRVNDTCLGGYCCQRIVADTEITVVPKVRATKPTPSPPFRLVGTSDDFRLSMKTVAQHQGLSLLCVPHCTMLIHPETIEAKVPGWEGNECQHAVVWRDGDKSTTPDDEVASNATIVKIRASETIGKDLVALHILNCYSIAATPFVDSVRIQLLSSQSINRATQRTQEHIDHNEVSVIVEKIDGIKDEGFPWKPWRSINEHVQSTSLLNVADSLLSDEQAMLLSNGSIFILSDNTSSPFLGRLTVTRFGEFSSNTTTDYFRVPSFIVSSHDLKVLPAIESINLSLPTTRALVNGTDTTVRPYRRAMDLKWVPSLLENRNCYDAWIFHGDVGTGKTHSAQLFAAVACLKWQLPSFYIDCKTLQSSHDLRMNSTLKELTQAFRDAFATHPSVLILDDLDYLASNMGDDESVNESMTQQQANPIANDQSKLLCNHLLSLIELCEGKVLFVITCNSTKALAPEILDCLPCHTSIEIESLSAAERTGMLHSMLELEGQGSLDNLSKLSEGFRAHDLRVVVSRAKRQSTSESETYDSLRNAMSDYVSLSRQGVVSETLSTVRDWNKDIGGLFDAKDQLKSTILDPIKYRRIYQQAPIKLPQGILLFGPPGCGKTFLVPALARECGHSLITCRGPELLDRYIGASEANVRRLFERARSSAPSILFLDEFDALAPRRGSDHTGVTDRVVNQLLTYLDGVETTLEGVFIIAATSRPDKIDPALLRPGRLAQHVYVGFPRSSEELNHLIMKMMSRRKMIDSHLIDAVGTGRFPLSREEADLLVQLSPADIKAMLDTAQLEAIHEQLDAPVSFRPHAVLSIREHHFRQALLSTRPSVSVQDRAMLDHIYQPFLGVSSRASYVKNEGLTQKEMKTSLK